MSTVRPEGYHPHSQRHHRNQPPMIGVSEEGDVIISTPETERDAETPIENLPYDEETGNVLDPDLPIEDFPYPEEPLEPTEASGDNQDFLIGAEEYMPEASVAIPQTFEGHCALLDAAIAKAIAGGYPDNPKMKIQGINRTIPEYIAVIIGGSRSGLNDEERKRIIKLYLDGPWNEAPHNNTAHSVHSIGTVAVSDAVTQAGTEAAPQSTGPIMDEVDDPWEKGKVRRSSSWEDRVSP